MKKNPTTILRVEQQLRPIYVKPNSEGISVTDDESFPQDIIADVLIWAHHMHSVESIDEIVDSALRHARYEITHDPEQE